MTERNQWLLMFEHNMGRNIFLKVHSLFWHQRFRKVLKANLREKVLFLRNSLGYFLIKKLDFEKTKPTQYLTFKTDITKVGLVFLISTFLLRKFVREGNLFAV